MNYTIEFGYNKYLWATFFAVKILEYTLLWSIIGVHLYSLAYGDYFSWVFLIVGTEVGYFIIISVLLINGLFKIREKRKIHGLLNLIGCILFIISGVRIIYIHKVQLNDLQDNWHDLQLLQSIAPQKYETAIRKFRVLLPLDVDVHDVKNQIEQMFASGVARGTLNIVEGLVLLIDSFLVYRESY